MRRLSVLVAALAVLATASLALPVPAQALSCVGPRWVEEPDAQIPHVLVGRIVGARDQHLEVEVAEIWKGPRLADHVWVRLDEGMAHWYEWSDADGEVPDGFSSPRTWVMAADADFEVGACSYWAMGRGVRRALEPDDPALPVTVAPEAQAVDAVPSGRVDPVRGAVPDQSGPLLELGAAASVGLIAVGAWWWRRRVAGT